MLGTTLLASILALDVQAGGFSMALWCPTFLKTVHHLTTVEVGYHMLVLTAGSFIGYIVAAYLCDAIGRRRNFLLFTLLNWVAIPAFLYPPEQHFRTAPARFHPRVCDTCNLQRARALLQGAVSQRCARDGIGLLL